MIKTRLDKFINKSMKRKSSNVMILVTSTLHLVTYKIRQTATVFSLSWPNDRQTQVFKMVLPLLHGRLAKRDPWETIIIVFYLHFSYNAQLES